MDQSDALDHEAHSVTVENQESQDHEEKVDPPDHKVQLDPLDLSDLMA